MGADAGVGAGAGETAGAGAAEGAGVPTGWNSDDPAAEAGAGAGSPLSCSDIVTAGEGETFGPV